MSCWILYQQVLKAVRMCLLLVAGSVLILPLLQTYSRHLFPPAVYAPSADGRSADNINRNAT